jgi:ceramide glucosyltransferase
LRLYWLAFLPAAAYQCLAIVAALWRLSRTNCPAAAAQSEPVSVLKPLRGLDPNSREAFISQINQDHPKFEVLFGARDAADPSVVEVRRLQLEFPQAPIRLIIGGEDSLNAKVGTLIELSRHARYPLRVVNDSDIKVDSQYLLRVTAPLRNPAIGVVTCLYRVKAHNAPAAWEALGIMTDFMPSTLVAQLIGVHEFGLGSTLAFRAVDLQEAGGFEALADYLADDYQLAKSITGLGKRTLLSAYVVETSLGDATWRGIWLHQLRWARTIRLTKGAGHLGLPITHAGLWAAIALATGAAAPALVLLGLRILSALLGGAFVLRSPFAACFCWLSPLWDVYSFAIWLASYAGKTVRWRDRTLKMSPDGRIMDCRITKS